ncbi:MAG: hypothetical protein BWY86_00704 [Candidatus Aminicenantes bacterium ADurb.Bin508]|nr:MAG: hypothetical protein BWY86_00704 [Candidatus Aminicenantes bacterium ADurb.Bin508]
MLPKAVMMITLVLGNSLFTLSRRSIPEIPGRFMSRRSRSGEKRGMIVSASSPLDASLTVCPLSSSRREKISRIPFSSSTMRIFPKGVTPFRCL